MVIERILVGNGTVLHGLEFEDGKLYGSSTLYGGAESFHKISTTNLNFLIPMRQTVSYKTTSLCNNTSNTFSWCSIDLQDILKSNIELFKEQAQFRIMRWCLQNLESVLMIGGPGSREVSNVTKGFYIRKFGRINFV